MKIVHIIPDLSCGGAEKVCIGLCNYMAQLHEVHLISLCDHTSSMYSLEMLDMRVKFLALGKSPGFNPNLFTRLWRALKLICPDVINTHAAGLLYVSPFILAHSGIRVFNTVHTYAYKESPRIYRLFYKILFKVRRVSLIPNSRAVWETIKKVYGRKNDQYVHLGIEEFHFSCRQAEVKREIEGYKRSMQTKVLLNIARISPEKNQIMFLRAFWELMREGYEAIALIIGGINDEFLFRKLQDFKHPSIYFLGKKDNIADYLATADIFCLTSQYEGFSLATIEAMSMKVIPICTPVGSIPELIRDGYNGLLSKDCSVAAYSSVLKRSFSVDEQTLSIMKENAFSTFKEYFTIERCGEEYLRLYKN